MYNGPVDFSRMKRHAEFQANRINDNDWSRDLAGTH